MDIGTHQIKFRQSYASDQEMEQLRDKTGKETNQDAIREAILRTIKGA